MKRICVVVTARPSYSRIKTALVALRDNCELQVVAAGSALVRRFGKVVDQIRADGFNVVMEVPCVVEGGGTREAAVSTGVLLSQLAGTFGTLRPDTVVTIADRHETLATAVAASYQNIPLCHVQGGEVSGSIDDKVRNAITQLADIHCVSSQLAGARVGQMHRGARIHVTGCPSLDLALEAYRLGPIKKAEVVVLQHPDTTTETDAARQMSQTVQALAPFGPRVMWFWPGEDAGGDAMSKELRMYGLKPTRNLEPVEFLRVLLGARVLVGNSSVGIRECSFLGVPVVNIGDRQRGRARGRNVLEVGYDAREILKGVMSAMTMERPVFPASYLYGDGHAGERIAQVLLTGTMEAVA